MGIEGFFRLFKKFERQVKIYYLVLLLVKEALRS